MQEEPKAGMSYLKVIKFSSLLIVIAVVLLGLYAVKGALFPFVIGLMLSYILHPFVSVIENFMPWRSRRPDLARGASIGLVYCVSLVVFIGALIVVVPPIFRQSTELLNTLPDFINGARLTVEGWSREYSGNIPTEISLEIERLLENAGVILVGAFRGLLHKTATAAVHALTLVVGMVVLPIFVFYLLKDREKVRMSFIEVFPSDIQIHVVYVLRILNRVVGAYVRAQVTLSVIVWICITVGLAVMQIQYAALLGAVAGIFEFVPIIGAWIGVIPTILVVLSTSPDKIIFVLILFGSVQILQGAFLVPRIQSFSMKVHPLIVLISIVIGSEVGGMWGVVLGPPIAASIKELIVYFSEPSKYAGFDEFGVSEKVTSMGEEVT